MITKNDESKTNNKTENKEAEKKLSNAAFLLQTDEKTKEVKGAHVNFSQDQEENSELPTPNPSPTKDNSNTND